MKQRSESVNVLQFSFSVLSSDRAVSLPTERPTGCRVEHARDYLPEFFTTNGCRTIRWLSVIITTSQTGYQANNQVRPRWAPPDYFGSIISVLLQYFYLLLDKHRVHETGRSGRIA